MEGAGQSGQEGYHGIYSDVIREQSNELSLDDEERAELHAAIEQGMDDLDAGRSVDAEVILAKVRARQA